MALQIEDYALIGDCKTAALSVVMDQSIGCAGLVLIRLPALPLSSGQPTMVVGLLPQCTRRSKCDGVIVPALSSSKPNLSLKLAVRRLSIL